MTPAGYPKVLRSSRYIYFVLDGEGERERDQRTCGVDPGASASRADRVNERIVKIFLYLVPARSIVLPVLG